VNFAFPATECPGIGALFEEGETAEVDFETGHVTNVTTGKSIRGKTTPPQLLKIIAAGGIFDLLEQEGAIAPRAPAVT
jgi:3-isopropylmalate/(R)-2-methylmalate dehydratase small subunit